MSDGTKRTAVWSIGILVALGGLGLWWLPGGDDTAVPAQPIAAASDDEPTDVSADESATKAEPEAAVVLDAADSESVYVTALAAGDRRLDPQGTLLAYAGGYLSIRQEFEPSDLTLADVVPEVADRFPADVHEALAAVGLDIGTADLGEAEAVLGEAGLLEKVTWIVADDPELYAAVVEVTGGGVWVPVVERSDDGLTWEPVDVALPGSEREVGSLYGSNGTHVVAAVADGDELRLFTSADLDVWTEVEVPVLATDLPEYVTTELWLLDLAVGPHGWFVDTYLSTTIAPSDVLPPGYSAGLGVHWMPVPEGIVLNYVEEERSETVPWSAMSITYDEWREIERDDLRAAYTGDFVGGIDEADRPGFGCCDVIPAVGGFFAWGWESAPSDQTLQALVPDIADRLPPEILDAFEAAGEEPSTLTIVQSNAILDEANLLYLMDGVVNNDPVVGDAYWRSTVAGVVAYSSIDGRRWVEATVPPVERVTFVGAVEGGLVAVGEDEEDPTQRYFLGDAVGSSWEEIDGPDVGGDSLWFSAGLGDGFGVVLDLGVDDGPEGVPWEGSVEYDGRSITVRGDHTGAHTVTIVDVGTGEVLLDRTAAGRDDGLWLVWTETIDFHAADGTVVASIPAIGPEREAIFGAQHDAWRTWLEANPTVAEVSLIATLDGRRWHVIAVELGENERIVDAQVLIHDGVAVFATLDAWHRVELR